MVTVIGDGAYFLGIPSAASSLLPKGLFGYIDQGAYDEVTIKANREELSTLTTLLGKTIAFPLILAPTGVAGVCWYEGEHAMERIPQPGAQARFQLYMWQETELSYAMGNLCWQDVTTLKKHWGGPLIIKGIFNADGSHKTMQGGDIVEVLALGRRRRSGGPCWTLWGV